MVPAPAMQAVLEVEADIVEVQATQLGPEGGLGEFPLLRGEQVTRRRIRRRVDERQGLQRVATVEAPCHHRDLLS